MQTVHSASFDWGAKGYRLRDRACTPGSLLCRALNLEDLHRHSKRGNTAVKEKQEGSNTASTEQLCDIPQGTHVLMFPLRHLMKQFEMRLLSVNSPQRLMSRLDESSRANQSAANSFSDSVISKPICLYEWLGISWHYYRSRAKKLMTNVVAKLGLGQHFTDRYALSHIRALERPST